MIWEQYPLEFREAIGPLLEIEGGYSNHPDDPGGRTMCGITERYYAHLWVGGPPTKQQITRVYWEDFWLKCGLDGIRSATLRAEIFESSVNVGSDQASLWLQEAYNGLSDYYGWVHLKEDCDVGSKTKRAVNRWIKRNPYPESERALVAVCNTFQANYYWTRPHRGPFLVGWFAQRVAPR